MRNEIVSSHAVSHLRGEKVYFFRFFLVLIVRPTTLQILLSGKNLFKDLNNLRFYILGFITICLLLFILWANSSQVNTTEISYIQDVQPILASKCYACHGPDEAKRKAGLRLDIHEAYFDTLESGNSALNAEDWNTSEMLKRIQSVDHEYIMPPPDFSKPLTPNEISLLSQWVSEGAKWENHWAYEPLEASIPPKGYGENPIDAFIQNEIKKQGLSSSPQADKRTLLRRLSFDLHGLPPSPEDLANFLADKSPNSYEKLVDKLLDSPRYGERWARHWLDIVHYGETHGYDKDKRRSNSWPYRDYVINALNQDIPYSRFVEDQLAGDILYPQEPQSIMAMGFLAAGPWDLVGHMEVRDGTVDKRIVRNLDRDDMVTSTISTFTSLTVHCARCHDHKFDPIKQTDYYSLQAVFAGIDRADRPFDFEKEIHKERTKLLSEKFSLTNKLEKLDEQLGPKEIQEIALLEKDQNNIKRKIQSLKVPPSPTYGYHSKIEEDPDHVKWIQLDLGKSYDLEQIVLVPGYKGEGLFMPGYGFPLRFKVELSNVPNFDVKKTVIDYSMHNHHARTDKSFIINFDKSKARYIRLQANKLWKGRGEEYFLAMAEIQAFEQGKNVARKAKVMTSDSFTSKHWHPRFLLDGYSSLSFLAGEPIPREKLNQIAREEVKLNQLILKEKQIRKTVLNERDKELLDEIQDSLREIEKSVKTLPEPAWVYAASHTFKGGGNFRPADSIRPIFLLNRGDTEQPKDEVNPGTVESFKGLESRFKLAEDHQEGDRRVALAKWITSKKNAFTWRSIVNRVWQYHFGAGIVASPNDFGKMGIPPTHPELLDYLALEFLKNGQSLKWLHRLILNSNTYKQVSFPNPNNSSIDSQNRFLWRAKRRQLEGEALRDGVLVVSGKIDYTMGGPGFDAFRYEDDHSPRYVYKDYNAYDSLSFRRAIYRSIIRSVPDPFMSTLDCADPSQSVPVRNETVTALQALSALNNPFMVRQAAFFAERLRGVSEDVPTQINQAFAWALLRKANKEELKTLASYIDKHGLEAFCRLIFAMNEFLYID